MRYLFILISVLAISLMAASCVHKVTCPAYQGNYLLDTAYLKKTFSLFVADSTPNEKIGIVKKDKYGIIEEKSYRKKTREMRSIEMVTIYPGYQDSIAMVGNIADSLAADTAQIATASSRIKLNYDQLLYNSMYGELLYPPVNSKREIQEDLKVDEVLPTDSSGIEGKGKFKLFKKKNKPAEEPAEFYEEAPPAEQDNNVPVEEEGDGF